ncbi:MAG: putative sugar nucleotidyl transferase [Nitrososphaerota archaeon]|nr:putative sugar nucleotidyl transferase [Candidatus Calditenuaceae archaeon]MDW8072865.1 putative sugar nucleotidyl transferase [Nitrososphaerota archaeon]
MNLLVFEDGAWRDFRQLTYLRPVYRLLTPGGPVLEAIKRSFKATSLYTYAREYLRGVELERDPSAKFNTTPESDSDALIINGLVRKLELVSRLFERTAGREFILLANGRFLAARLKGSRVADVEKPEDVLERLGSLVGMIETLEAPGESVFHFLWELIDDWRVEVPVPREPLQLDSRVAVLGDLKSVSIPSSCEVEPFTVIDTRRGPVVLGEGVKVEAGSKLIGPCVIGENSIVYGGRVGPYLYTGPVCRVSAEIEHTVMLGYSNKHHYGFIGHSIIGEWVNIAAGTTTSNLKTTYGEVKVVLDGKTIHTGRQFLGSIMGDHVRTMVDTTIMTGKLLGPFSVLSGMVAKNILPFIGINFAKEMYELDLESELRVVERMMARRGLKPSENYLELVRRIFELTREERAGLKGHRSDRP